MALVLEVLGELARERGLSGTLQAGEHDHRWRKLGVPQTPSFAAQDRDQFLVDDLDDLLRGVQRPADLLAYRSQFDRGNELAHNRQCDVGLEQRNANLASGGIDIGLGQPTLASQSGENLVQPVRQCVEHSRTPQQVRNASPPGYGTSGRPTEPLPGTTTVHLHDLARTYSRPRPPST